MSKHPDVDHAGHLQRMQAAIDGVSGAKLFTVDCLDQCDRSNVVVVRSHGERRWFGDMLDDGTVSALADWLAAGGTGGVPADLDAHGFDPGERASGLMTTDPRQGTDLGVWLAELVAAGGGWIVGVPGSVVEVHAAHAPVPLRITDDMRAFTVGRADDPTVPVVIAFAAVTAPALHGVPELPLGLQIPKGFLVRAVHFPGG